MELTYQPLFVRVTWVLDNQFFCPGKFTQLQLTSEVRPAPHTPYLAIRGGNVQYTDDPSEGGTSSALRRIPFQIQFRDLERNPNPRFGFRLSPNPESITIERWCLFSNGGAYHTQVQCGDKFLDTAEKCDDGNVIDGDGCSSRCQVEPGWTCDTIYNGTMVYTDCFQCKVRCAALKP